eukprot:TRINITY_DN6462_c3_g1_i1.p2 TRINITY_DN6462_c3_g1~~TRINITY_DN6462_c3_g1_i1.p2  ORF type:complete len:171 (-),score=22.52 TRINITY_DN6462_c3_g1_i1:277-738(-)
MNNITNFLKVEGYGTAGQPTNEQFKVIQEQGYEVVINIRMSDVDHDNEGKLVSGLGMVYVHQPVSWENPQVKDLQLFFNLLKAFEGMKVFIHCKKNMRVAVFIYLWRILLKGHDAKDALKDVHKIWTPGDDEEDPDNVWVQFQEKAIAQFKNQ